MIINHKDLPIEFVSSKGKIKKNHFLVKARLEFIIDNIEITLVGSSFGSEEDICIEKAKSEIIERFYSHKFIATNEFYSSRQYIPIEINKIQKFRNNQVTLGNDIDATGLSFHTKENAEKHAIKEIIERHWLSKVWYENEGLILIEHIHYQDYELMILALDKYDIPFTIAAIINKGKKILFCGSSLKSNYLDSKNHSTNEAYMLYEGYLEQDPYSPNIAVTKSQKRIATLNRTIFDSQLAHLKSMIKSPDNQIVSDNEYDLTHIINISTLNIYDFYIIDFYKFQNQRVVRVINNNTLSLKILRDKRKSFLQDPFY